MTVLSCPEPRPTMHDLPGFSKAFAELGIEVRFLKALRKMGFETPSEVQAALIPVALTGRDVLGQARTGTGKTAAFGLPILQQLDPNSKLQAICLAPTRELAVQVAAELTRLAEYAKLHVVEVYGGQKVATQIHRLGRRPHFVVGTPGRVMDFLHRGVLDFSGVRHVVLDEVDRMLDIGFRDDIKSILDCVPSERQTIFVSATVDAEIKRLALRFMKEPAEVNVSRDHITVDEIDQSYVTVDPHQKFAVLRAVLEEENPPVAIIFCNTKASARKLAKRLYDLGVNAKEIHGDLDQRKRDRVMESFRKHRLQVLVATDLAARGIDVSAISHIINYDIPKDPEIYVHRVGRTGRMGSRGVAITFVTREEGKQLTAVEMLINRQIPVKRLEGFEEPPAHATSAGPVRSKPAEPALVAPSAAAPAVAVLAAGSRSQPPRTLGGRFRPARRRRR